jgi:hypothetical protein
MITEHAVQPTEPAEEVTELEGEYVRPMLSISKSVSVGDVTHTIRVELEESKAASTGGDIAVIVEAALRVLNSDKLSPEPATQYNFAFTPGPPGMAEHLREAVRRNAAATAGGGVGNVDDLEAELARVEEHDQQCGQDHTTWMDNLRNEILRARSAKATSDRAAGTEQPYDQGGDLPPGVSQVANTADEPEPVKIDDETQNGGNA